MILRSLTADRFRNLSSQEVALHPRLTLLHGDNAQGTTNFLEAVYFLAALRSFRTQRPAECIRWGEEQARLEGEVETASRVCRIVVALGPSSREVTVDGKQLARLRDFRGDFGAVLFTPEDLGLARGPRVERRRLLDRGVFTACPTHLADLLDYERALRARNALLRSGAAWDEVALVHTQTLARLGAVVVSRRLRWIGAMRPLLAEVFQDLAETTAAADLQYEETVPGQVRASTTEEIEARLFSHWERTRERDLARGYTASGPHTDDLAMMLDGRPLRLAGSQGQQRAFVLALKLAEVRLVEEARGESPALLLDDVASELDERRRRALFCHLEGMTAQVVVTTTAAELIPVTRERFQYRAVTGVLTREL
jgi:DNA replication and repair protein RecF